MELRPTGHNVMEMEKRGSARVSHHVLEGRAPAPGSVTGAGARSFGDDEALLGSALEAVVRAGNGEPALALHERAVALAQRSRTGETEAADELAQLVGGLSVAEAEVLIRSLTRWFQLLNLAEDNERVRRLRARGDDNPGSARNAIRRLASRGVTAEELADTLAAAELRLVITAHPTEARRRTTIEKLSRIFATLRELDERASARSADRLPGIVQELWGSDDVRTVSLNVGDEVQGGLDYLSTTLARTIPVLYRELEAAIAEFYPGEEVTVPPLLTFGSWMGGDRDGNPNVTPAATVAALDAMRNACLRFLEGRIGELAGRLSLSSRLTGVPPELDALEAAAAERFPDLAVELERRHPQEPYRRAVTLVRARVQATREDEPGGYAGPDELLADLRTTERALQGPHGGFVAAGDLRDVIRQVEVFGFHFARLDVREHAKVHRQAIGEILSALGIHESYATLGDDERAALLAREIADPRPLIPLDLTALSGATRDTIATFRMLREVLTGKHAGAVQAFVISGTSAAADVLEVLLLMKECGLARPGGEGARLRIVPLFESGDTLDAAGETMRALLSHGVYRAALRAVGDEQEVMIGYSDSNKDVGYVASGWATYRAQIALAQVLREHGLAWTFFHGRGGAVGRGGGKANVAIIAQPVGTVRGRMKMTEQGEVLSAKYSVAEIAERELELTTSAVLLSTLERETIPEPTRRRYQAVVERMAERSRRAYRALVYEDPDFDAFFRAATPVEEISRQQLGSRPARRGAAQGIEDFRAIPWVFSWTQARIVLPAWYGLGTALAGAVDDEGIELVREMARDWRFFAALLSNAEMACAKADLAIGHRYAELCPDAAVRERIWGAIAAEFERTTSHLVAVSGGDGLLAREPVLRDSIARRNPYVDPLSYVQLERLRAGDGDGELARASLYAVNGIASGLRNTG
jgi:phosphoenolpyruvate carboxylase